MGTAGAMDCCCCKVAKPLGGVNTTCIGTLVVFVAHCCSDAERVADCIMGATSPDMDASCTVDGRLKPCSIPCEAKEYAVRGENVLIDEGVE